MAQHSPSPWSVADDDTSTGVPFIPIRSSEHETICETCSTFVDGDVDFAITPQDRANARLIAAAPELLWALKDVVASYKSYRRRDGDDETSDSIEHAEEILAKAETQS